MRRIDLSHVVAHGLVTYPGLPAPTLRDHLSQCANAICDRPNEAIVAAMHGMVVRVSANLDNRLL